MSLHDNRDGRDAQGALEAILFDAALLEAEQRGDHDAPEVWADSLAASLRAEMARQRQAELNVMPAPAPVPVIIPPHVQAMTRRELETRVAMLRRQAGPSLQVAYRNLEEQTEGDLRILVALLEEPDEEEPTP
jgi:hypothetical protein